MTGAVLEVEPLVGQRTITLRERGGDPYENGTHG
jgi:hypothetical protein